MMNDLKIEDQILKIKELFTMTQDEVKLGILTGVIAVKATENMLRPYVKGLYGAVYQDVYVKAISVAEQLAECQAEIQSVFDEIAEREAGDIFTQGDSVDLDLEDTEFHAYNPWDQLIDDINMEQELCNANDMDWLNF